MVLVLLQELTGFFPQISEFLLPLLGVVPEIFRQGGGLEFPTRGPKWQKMQFRMSFCQISSNKNPNFLPRVG